jgi:hypothetical protein
MSFVAKVQNPRYFVRFSIFTLLMYLSIIEISDFQARRFHAYSKALALAGNTPVLGSHFKVKWPVKENGTLSNESGDVNMTISLTSDHGPATLHVVGTNFNGYFQAKDISLFKDGARYPLSTAIDAPGARP